MFTITHGRYATVTSTLALVVALGGTSYAAVMVTGADIKNGTVTTDDIKDKTLKTKDLAPGTKASLEGARGPAGPAGPAGPQGPPGAPGAAGTARASAQVAAQINPVYDANHGFPSLPRRIAAGKYCVPAPAGVNADSTAVLLSLSGNSVGYVLQSGPPAASCRADEFEIWTLDSSYSFVDGIFFNILVP
jgi:hypothetical protein